ncbi:hypothetical protein HYFRA_00011751 [Hymenoscyphus fraxineus]|uniref:Uncharacterized protein n=1 Tax=Hymenoscyphus fraxineus TaxID=746836 RepID=A0A9N9L6U7_9HELO|nr:hypothetical protein HYFRA_00011751 [Hymenoscyphus fraxineus]
MTSNTNSSDSENPHHFQGETDKKRPFNTLVRSKVTIVKSLGGLRNPVRSLSNGEVQGGFPSKTGPCGQNKAHKKKRLKSINSGRGGGEDVDASIEGGSGSQAHDAQNASNEEYLRKTLWANYDVRDYEVQDPC